MYNEVDDLNRRQGLWILEETDRTQYVDYLDGKIHGNWKTTYEDVIRDRKIFYGKLNGYYKIYYYGNILSERNFLNDIGEAEQIIYE